MPTIPLSNLTIIMYHYVRDVGNTFYPEIHALSVDVFRRQVEQLQNKYSLVSGQDVLRAILEGGALPINACLLSFDDGLKDHYRHVYPMLKERKLQAVFFPITETLDGKVSDVNKIQFLLAKVVINRLIKEFHEFLAAQPAELKNKFVINDKVKIDPRYRFDDTLTANFKVTIQSLPGNLRRIFLQNSFNQWIGDEKDFASELYLSRAEIQEMSAAGQIFGSHTDTHPRLNLLSRPEQQAELARSKNLLEKITGQIVKIISYPHGSYNQDTLELLEELGYCMGLGTEVGINEKPFEQWALKRINANDI